MIWLLAALLAASTSAISFDDCYSPYYETYVLGASSLPSDQQCIGLEQLNTCFTDLLATTVNSTDADQIESTLSSAIAAVPDCDVSQLAVFQPYIQLQDSNIEFHVGQDKDVAFFAYNRQTISVADLQTRITALQNNASAIQTQLTSKNSALSSAAASTLVAAQTLFTSLMTSGVATLNTNLNAINSTGSSYQYYVASNLSSIIAFRNATNTAIEAEEEALFALQFNTTTNIASTRIALQLGLNDDIVGRSQVTADDTTYLLQANQSITSTISSFMVQEDSRAAFEFQALTAATSALVAFAPSTISSSLSAEIARVTISQSTAVKAVIARPNATNGANDDMPCTNEGAIYYSTPKSRWYLCNSSFWIYMMPSYPVFAAQGGTIMNAQQQNALYAFTGYKNWALCFSTVIHGVSSSTFHANCDNKGPTLSVYGSGAGVFGGYNDQAWQSSNQNFYSAVAFLFRFTGNNLNYAYNSGLPNYSTYNSNSYGPWFGYSGCGDFYSNSGGDVRSFYTNSCGYYANPTGYSSSWMTGIASQQTATKLEVYYRV